MKKLLKYFYNNRDIGLAIKRDNTSDLIIVAIINVLLKSEFDLKSWFGVILWVGKNFHGGLFKKSTIVYRSSI